MIKAASLDISVDLRSFSQFLRQQGVRHRIIEESGQQVVWVESPVEANFVLQSLQDFETGITAADVAPAAPGSQLNISGNRMLGALLRAFMASPVTLSMVAICLLVAVISSLGSNAGRVDFLFYPLVATDGVLALLRDLDSPQLVLRTLTPMFLHFGELHLVFNMLWLWYFGRQLEAIQPGWTLLVLIIVMAFVSNTTQYLAIDYNNFGGMSGVVYGLVGYTWIIHSFMPRSYLMLNNNMFVFFVVALVLMELVASSWIATAAHVGGLVCGALAGVITVLYYRLVLRRPVVGRINDST